MSGHLRFFFGAFVLLAVFSTAPASSNPFADLFNAAPPTAAAPPSAEKECLPRPGKSAADGQHWVYRLDGHRKCWFLAAEGIARAKKPVHVLAAKDRVAAVAKNETAWSKQEATVDARAELPRSAQPVPPASKIKVVAATSDASGLVPSAPVDHRATHQAIPDRPTPREVDLETRVAAAPAASNAVAVPVAPTSPVAFPIAEAADDERGWTENWLGLVLMALGLVSVLSSSQTVREAIMSRD
jgi:hypothetical protein